MVDSLAAICSCPGGGEEAYEKCAKKSSIFFDMAKRQQHFTTELLRKDMLNEMKKSNSSVGDATSSLAYEYDEAAEKKIGAQKDAINLLLLAGILDKTPIQETIETITCINVLLQTKCHIHTVYFLGHYDGTLLIQKYIEGFYYDRYEQARAMGIKKLTWYSDDELDDTVKFHQNSMTFKDNCSGKSFAVDKKNEITTRLQKNKDKPLSDIYEETGLLAPLQKPKPKRPNKKIAKSSEGPFSAAAYDSIWDGQNSRTEVIKSPRKQFAPSAAKSPCPSQDPCNYKQAKASMSCDDFKEFCKERGVNPDEV
jgi:hypothetical protein